MKTVVRFFWAKRLHGGALDYGSSKQPTTALAAFTRGIRCVSTSKVGSTPAFAPNFLDRLRSSNAEQAVLTRKVVSSSLTGGTRGSSKLSYADDILRHFETADAEAPMPGNNWGSGLRESNFFEVWPNGKARRLGRWDWRFDSSHLDEKHGYPESPCRRSCTIAAATMRRRAASSSAFEKRLGLPIRGRGRLVRRQLAKLIQAGSIPVVRSLRRYMRSIW